MENCYSPNRGKQAESLWGKLVVPYNFSQLELKKNNLNSTCHITRALLDICILLKLKSHLELML